VSSATWRPGRFTVQRTEPLKIPEFILKSSAFVASVASESGGKKELDLEGSGFFVGVKSIACPPYSFFYFITAAHVVSECKTKTAIRLNRRDNSVAVVEVERWYYHPTDSNADVAVAPIVNHPEYDVLFVEDHYLRVRSALKSEDIGIGDEVFFPGLFWLTQGDNHKNQPIVRHGNVAMIPNAPIPAGKGFMDAYLIEARSIGGLSGSPVYVRRTMSLLWNDDASGKSLRSLHGMTGEIHLMGMIHGHWDVKESEINQPRLTENKQGVNMGIAIVIPSEKILETINQPELVAMREKEEIAFLEKQKPTMD
jgi:hypothetical protein